MMQNETLARIGTPAVQPAFSCCRQESLFFGMKLMWDCIFK